MSRRLRQLALQWRAKGIAAMVVEVAAVSGSAPREAGARMLVAAHETAGTIGGGHLEWQAIAHARALLGDPGGELEQRMALGPRLGQCCGGVVRLRYAALDSATLLRWSPPPPLWHLQLHGAGHVGGAIARVLAPLEIDLDWVDERDPGFGAGPWPDSWRLCASDDAVAEVAAAPTGSRYLILTHSHELDLRLVEAVLARGDFSFLGLIGSATKRARFAARLSERGFSAAQIERMRCPIGLPAIPGKTPEVIAVAVCAQLLALGSGADLARAV
ncbi:MAG: xanthine dehydrogenase accessory protein XdhC [Burkholderiaceae bacterium]